MLSFALLFLVSLRVVNVHFDLHAFLRASRCSYTDVKTRSYMHVKAVMTTPGLALDKVFSPQKISHKRCVLCVLIFFK